MTYETIKYNRPSSRGLSNVETIKFDGTLECVKFIEKWLMRGGYLSDDDYLVVVPDRIGEYVHIRIEEDIVGGVRYLVVKKGDTVYVELGRKRIGVAGGVGFEMWDEMT